jgi:serine/threonine protein kinase HipA of HipAB toxin-antitoxin module
MLEQVSADRSQKHGQREAKQRDDVQPLAKSGPKRVFTAEQIGHSNSAALTAAAAAGSLLKSSRLNVLASACTANR